MPAALRIEMASFFEARKKDIMKSLTFFLIFKKEGNAQNIFLNNNFQAQANC